MHWPEDDHRCSGQNIVHNIIYLNENVRKFDSDNHTYCQSLENWYMHYILIIYLELYVQKSAIFQNFYQFSGKFCKLWKLTVKIHESIIKNKSRISVSFWFFFNKFLQIFWNLTYFYFQNVTYAYKMKKRKYRQLFRGLLQPFNLNGSIGIERNVLNL